MAIKKKVDLGKLADEAQAALNFLAEQGYEDEVQAVRDYLIAQGEHFAETQRINRDILRSLASQQGKDVHGAPV